MNKRFLLLKDSRIVLLAVFVLTFMAVLAPLSSTSQGTTTEYQKGPLLLSTLTQKEKDWIDAHETIKIAGPKAFPPFHYFEKDGTLNGMAADYTVLIAARLGIKIDIQNNLSWPEVLKKAEQKKIDLIACAAKSSEREKFLSFGNPFLSFPMVIISKKDAPFIGGLKDLDNKKVAVVSNVITQEWLFRDRINILPHRVDTPVDALKAVSMGFAEAYIGNLAATSYLIEKNGLFNLKVAAPTSYGNYELYFAARADFPELTSIINKALESITPQEHAAIRNKWLSIRYEYGISKIDIIKWGLFFIFTTLIIGVFIFIWNKKLEKVGFEKNRAQKSLQKVDHRFRQLTQNISEVFWIVSPDWSEVHYCSPAYEKIWERPVKDLYEKPFSWLSAVVKEDRGMVSDIITKKSMEDFTELVFPEFRISRPDGSIRWIFARGFPSLNKDGLVDSVVGVAEDITTRKGYQEGLTQSLVSYAAAEKARTRVEEALRVSENRFRDISLSMADWIWEVDNDDKFTYVSRGVKDVLGYSPEELIGTSPFDIMPEDEAVRIKAVVSKIQSEQGTIKDMENWNLDRDGNRVCVLTNGIPILDDKGELKGYRGVDKNITAQKNLEKEKENTEAQLQQALKMEAVGTLSGGIAHDFNNILGIIIGNAELAEYDIPESNPARLNMEKIKTASLRARDVVQQLLSFSRQTSQDKHIIKIKPIIEESIKLLRSSIPTSIEIILEILDDSGTIEADPTQIHQVLINLCTNAAHAMDKDGGILGIRLSRVDLDEMTIKQYQNIKPGPYVQLTISDTGHGIGPAVRPKIFDPYFTTKGVGKGSGMGLAVVLGIVKNHNGIVSVYSEPGHGSTFKVVFPSADQETLTESRISPEIPKGEGKILFIDDEDFLVKTGAQILERLGYQVEARTDPVKALDLFKSDPSRFDLVITDMTMPQLTGDLLAKEILKIDPGMPIILCTGFSGKIDYERAIGMGIRSYIEKPLNMGGLARAVRDVLTKPRDLKTS